MPTCTHTGRFISVLLCSGQSELASICLFVQINNQLDDNIKRLYFNNHRKFRVYVVNIEFRDKFARCRKYNQMT